MLPYGLDAWLPAAPAATPTVEARLVELYDDHVCFLAAVPPGRLHPGGGVTGEHQRFKWRKARL